jgi:hypothetical protein
VTTDSVSVSVSTPLWFHWAAIAVDQERFAVRARNDVQAAQRRDEGASEFGSALERQLHSALLSICATAFALEAFFVGFEKCLPRHLRVSGQRTRAPKVREGLKQTYHPSRKLPRWEAAFDRVIELRGKASHFAEESRAPASHEPSWVFTTWTSEEATHAVDLLLGLLRVAAETSSNQCDGGYANPDYS